jgi:AraC-like DNA-binding protein
MRHGDIMSLLFTPEYRQMLTAVEQWKIICSNLPPECPENHNAKHIKWLKNHVGSHPQREAVFCFEGNVPGSLENRIYSCAPGTLLLFDAGEKHDHEYPPGTNAVHLWLFFVQKQILVRLITITDGRMSQDRRGLFVDNPGLYNLLVQEWSGLKNSLLDESLKRKRLLAIFSLLFIELIESDLKEETTPEDDSENPNGQQYKIIRLIEEHIRNTSGNGLTIEKLARIAGYSKFHFLRVFKKQTGYKVHDYINLARINRVAEMEATGARHKEISEALGFSCPSVYSHWRNKHLKHK